MRGSRVPFVRVVSDRATLRLYMPPRGNLVDGLPRAPSCGSFSPVGFLLGAPVLGHPRHGASCFVFRPDCSALCLRLRCDRAQDAGFDVVPRRSLSRWALPSSSSWPRLRGCVALSVRELELPLACGCRSALFRRAIGVYHFGRFRRSDWLPTGEFVEGQQVRPEHELSDSDWSEESDGSGFADEAAAPV